MNPRNLRFSLKSRPLSRDFTLYALGAPGGAAGLGALRERLSHRERLAAGLGF